MKLLDGMLAGAAGTLALDVATYADMAVRARPPSRTPQESVRRIAERAHVDLGPQGEAENRRTGLGALLGYGAGVTAATALSGIAVRRSLPVAAGMLAAAAMVGTSGPMTALGVTDPRRWSARDWLSDIVPHLAYGVVTAVTLRRLAAGRRPRRFLPYLRRAQAA